MANATVYIKPMTWAGKTKYYLGLEPSRPEADYCNRLGSFFLVVGSLESARAVARSYGGPVVECPHYVGLEQGL